ncbi:DedA family protein [Microbacterium karelineae]|uniref:DedA family protein n=1 Tax=Microbacterium karelineae TaxID=2654283 RepID=UPI001E306ED1|nr:VTT domain-containing protein [Microbacterium karelineae]
MLLDSLLALAASPWIYLIVFALAVLDGLLPPVPSETVIVGAAALSASTGRPDWALIAIAAAAGAFTGDNLVYAIGRAVGTTRFRWMRTGRARRAIDMAERGLASGGASAIFVARYIPVGRVAVNLTAGAVRYPRQRFVLLALGAAATWAAYSVAIGTVAGRLVEDQPLLGVAVGVGLAIVVGVVVDRLLAWRRAARAKAVRRRAGDQDPSSSAAANSTGTQPSVVRNTVSRESTYPTP